MRVNLGLEVRGVDRRDHLAFAHAVAFAHDDLLDFARHLGAHRGLEEGRERSRERQRALQLAHLDYRDVRRRELERRLGLVRLGLVFLSLHAQTHEGARDEDHRGDDGDRFEETTLLGENHV